ncbi:MAG: hypothetical protein LH702_14335 [Phormidesmis sp. CAN_BIN44]|nr:hypothetical protein [Phormidesmis sp. CAN_BIN44]
MEKQLSILPVVLSEQIPKPLPIPKFQLGQAVKWACVPTGDYGQVVGIVFGSEGSIRALGFHYEIALDASSPSYIDGITSDWGFEDDLALVALNPAAGDRLEDSL